MRDYPTVFDISLPLYEGMISYPNNPGLTIEPMRTKTSFISKLSMSSHTGTHVDVPRHVFEDGIGVDAIDPAVFVGPCRVLDMTHVKGGITVADLESAALKEGERILVKTQNSLRGFHEFYDDYIYLDGDAAEYVAARKIALFGIDSLSIKKKGSDDVRAHNELLKNGIIIFEGLDLARVMPGEYFFIGLPLKLVGLDGAPVRAVLLS
ncbi:MAG: cyclase family protein [Parcubacteria group bacterium]|nr:cyclase family protein [Parcubacteria group bacterium]